MAYRGQSGGLCRTTAGGWSRYADTGADDGEEQDDLFDEILAKRAAYEKRTEDPGHHFMEIDDV